MPGSKYLIALATILFLSCTANASQGSDLATEGGSEIGDNWTGTEDDRNNMSQEEVQARRKRRQQNDIRKNDKIKLQLQKKLDVEKLVDQAKDMIDMLEEEEELEERQDQFENTTPVGLMESPTEQDELELISEEIQSDIDAPIQGWMDKELRDEQIKELQKFAKLLEQGKTVDTVEFDALKDDILSELAQAGMKSFLESETFETWKMRIIMAVGLMIVFSFCSCVVMWKIMQAEEAQAKAMQLPTHEKVAVIPTEDSLEMSVDVERF